MLNKNFIIVLITTVIFFTAHQIYPQNWKWINPYPQGNELCNVHLNNVSELISSGACGTIVRTTNHGVNWFVSNKISGYSDVFRYYYRYDNNIIFIGSDYGKIFKSTDGGTSFNISSTLESTTIISIQMLDLNTGFACGSGKLMKTTNSGLNWNAILTTSYTPLNSMICFSENIIIAASSQLESPALIKRTTNGGVNWNDTIFQGGGTLRLEKLLTSNTAIAYNNGKILKTTNAGTNWIIQNSSNPVLLGTIYILDSNYFFGCYNNLFYLSSNGGMNWVQKNAPDYFSGYGRNNISFFNSSTGYVLFSNNRIYYTTNAGSNWLLISQETGSGTSATWLKNYWFTDNSTGFITGTNNTFLKTTDAGNTWLPKASPYGSSIKQVCFININTGFAIGSSGSGIGLISKTTNAGDNWFHTDSSANYTNSNKIKFFSSTTGILTVLDDKLYRTTNGGYIWTQVLPVNLNSVYDICILNSTTGFISGRMSNSESRIYKSTDAGESWFQVFGGQGSYTGFYSMKFINTSTGYCAGYGLLKTTNGGNNWFQVNAPTTSFCTNIEIVNDSVMYISTYGVIYKSTNAGYSWGSLNIPTNNRIEFSKFFNANTGIIAGDHNNILRTTNGGGSFTSLIRKSGNITNGYYLFQNYPNPFNPMTNVKFSIVKSGDVKIVVYDITGREAQTLVNERLQPGTYETTFNGSAYSSGVYFYKLITDGFSETKRMLLLK